MLAELTSPSRARSLGKPSPRSAFKSIDPRGSVGPFLDAFMASGLEFGHRDRLETDSITPSGREVPVLGRCAAKRRCPEEMPTAWRLAGIDAGLPSGDGDRAPRHAQAGRIAARQARQSRRQITRVREPWQETDREDVVLGTAVQIDHIGGAQVQ